jgi:hypothetical protein
MGGDEQQGHEQLQASAAGAGIKAKQKKTASKIDSKVFLVISVSPFVLAIFCSDLFYYAQ